VIEIWGRSGSQDQGQWQVSSPVCVPLPHPQLLAVRQ
jgi:hypothetical protein